MPEKILSKIFDIFLGLAVCTEVALIAISPFIYAITWRVVLIGLAVCFCIFMSWLGVNIYCDILAELREINKKLND